jgi:stress-induced morphogen
LLSLLLVANAQVQIVVIVVLMTDAIIAERIAAAFPGAVVTVTVIDASSGKFGVKVVSDAFEGKSLVARHRAVNAAVGMSNPDTQALIHALNIEARTPQE